MHVAFNNDLVVAGAGWALGHPPGSDLRMSHAHAQAGHGKVGTGVMCTERACIMLLHIQKAQVSYAHYSHVPPSIHHICQQTKLAKADVPVLTPVVTHIPGHVNAHMHAG